MKLLLDTCVSRGAQAELAYAGHDVVHTGESEPDPGDEEILAQAHRENRILVTLDKDFGELAIIRGHEHSGIVRLVGISAKRQGAVRTVIIEQYGEQLVLVPLSPWSRDAYACGRRPTTRGDLSVANSQSVPLASCASATAIKWG